MSRPKVHDGLRRRYTIVLPDDIADEVEAIADEEATPLSVLIRRWIIERLRPAKGAKEPTP